VSLEEQKKSGGKPGECTVFELFTFHLLESDAELDEVRGECLDGERMCGPCKKQAAELMMEFLKDIAEKRELAKERLDEFLAEDSK